MAKVLPSANRKRVSGDKFSRAESSIMLGGGEAIEKIPLAVLVENPYNERIYYSERIVQQRAEDLLEQGQIQPITIAPHPEQASKFIVIDGHYRWKGAEVNSWDTIDAKKVNISTPEEFYKLSRDANRNRENSSVFDQAAVFQKLLEDNVFNSQVQLAKSEKLAESSIAKILGLNDLPANVKILLATQAESKINIATAYELLMFWRDLYKTEHESPDEHFFAFCETQVIANGIGRNEINNRRKLLIQKKPAKKPKPIPYLSFLNEQNKQVGSFDKKGRNISLKYRALNDEQAALIADKIESLFKELGL